jgi:hypothetical protein
MTKRTKFITTSVVLSVSLFLVSLLDNRLKLYAIGGLSIVTILLFYWSLVEGIGRNATMLVLILPSLFTLGVGLFWFLLPASIFATLPVIFFYAIGINALCRTMNIFTVSAIRTIALARAAKGVGFVLTLFTYFLLFDAVLSLKASIFINFIITFFVSFPLFLQGLWTSKLSTEIDKELFIYSIFFSYILSSASIMLYFWPVRIVVGSLFLTVGVYVLLGLGQAKIEARIFRQTINEYLFIGIFVFIAMFLVTSWRG